MSKYDKASLVHIPSGYKSGTLYNVLPNNADGDFDFTRASTATRVDENGLIETVASGVPRLDYPLLDGVVQDNPTLLLEPQRTNLVQYSEDYSSFTKFGCSVISNDTTFIGGGLADKIQEDSSNTNKHIRPANISITSGQSYIMSAWFKTDNCDVIAFREGSSSGDSITYKFSTETTSSTGTRWTSLNVINYSNGWRRIEAKYTSTSTASMNFRIHLLGNNYNQLINPNPSTYTYQGDGTSGIYMWGLSLEQGSYATSYIPTNGEVSGVTRSADICNGAGTANDFNDSEGVLYANISALANDGTSRIISISDPSATNRIHLFYFVEANYIYANYRAGGTTRSTAQYEINNVLNPTKVAYKYKSGDFSLWINGFEVDTDTNTTMIADGALTKLSFEQGNGGNNFYGKAKRIGYFDAVLTDAELEALTSYTSFTNMANELNLTIK